MRRLHIEIGSCPEELRPGIAEIMAERFEHFVEDKSTVAVRFEKEPSLAAGALRIERKPNAVVVRYGSRIAAFRALGRLMGESGSEAGDTIETPRFDTLGVMVDVSRNGVLTLNAAKALLRRCALMGLNMFMLYAEDTYEVPGEPFFGYLRGRYTQEELKELDDHADALGIEVIPCIQTLGHLTQILQWPAYAKCRDTSDVLLAEDPDTYALVEKMIVAASSPLRSKRIHVGMDEAHGIGSGRYKAIMGEKRPFDILNKHLLKVSDICHKLGLRPMMWSDMYFRLGSKSNAYYDLDAVIPQDVIAAISKDVQLVYWDYYHDDQDFYEKMIDIHAKLGSNTVMAGGVWTWGRFWTSLNLSYRRTEACMNACKSRGLREVFMTLWGDDGMECDVFSSLPGLQFFAEHGYADTVNADTLRANLLGSCGIDFDDWTAAGEMDIPPTVPSTEYIRKAGNISKCLLWQDPLIATIDPNIEGIPFREKYAALSERLSGAAKKSDYDARLVFPAQIARVLSLKTNFRRELATAYAEGDRAKLRAILDGPLPELRKEVRSLWKCHRDMWLATYKPFGLEVIEQRYGGVMARLESLSDRLASYLDGSVQSIPEFDAKLERAFPQPCESLNLTYKRIGTPSALT